tara:strand:- start:317 stop:472 length:156 start_codon:yes stop_codon:yes gene_type:complete
MENVRKGKGPDQGVELHKSLENKTRAGKRITGEEKGKIPCTGKAMGSLVDV